MRGVPRVWYVPGWELSRGKKQRGREYDVRVHRWGGPHGGGGGQGQLVVVGSDEGVKARERGERDELHSGQGRGYGGYTAT